MKTYQFLAFVLLVLITGCAEKPTSVGNGLPNIDGNFTVVSDTLYAVRDTSYSLVYAPGSSFTNLTGRLSPTEEIISLFNFIPGGTIDSLKGAKIDTVEFQLTVNYRYFTKVPPVQFNIVEVKRPWSQSTFTSDSVPGLTLGTSVLGTFSDTMLFASRVYTLITDTAAVRRWAQSYYDTSSSVPDFYGFAVRAPLGVTTGVVGFSTFTNAVAYLPTLVIRYTKNGTRNVITVATGEDTYGTISTAVPAYTPLTLRGVFTKRSKVIFDHSPLLNAADPVNKPIVNIATMELTLDTLASALDGFFPDSIAAVLGMSPSNTDLSDSTVYVYGTRRAVTAGTPPVYSFPVTKIVDRWVRGVNPNYGINLRWYAENGAVEKAVFYSRTNADIAKRPKMFVTYSKK